MRERTVLAMSCTCPPSREKRPKSLRSRSDETSASRSTMRMTVNSSSLMAGGRARRGGGDPRVESADPLVERRLARERGADVGSHPGVDLFHHREQQVVLRREVVVDHTDVRSRLARDLAQRGAVHALREELLPRGRHDPRREVRPPAGHQASFFRKRRLETVSSTQRMPTIQASSGSRSTNPLPLRAIPRTMRRKCVSGSACDSHCAKTGMPSQGNMNPERSMFGSRKKKDICIACCCVFASVEKKSPRARFPAMNTPAIA